MKLSRHNQGDTIIEILVCLAVMGAALVISSSLANRSLFHMRQAQERTEALKLAEEQAERIKQSLLIYGSAPSFDPHAIFYAGALSSPGFCIKADLTVVRNVTSPTQVDCISETNDQYFAGAILVQSGGNNEFIIAAGRSIAGGSSGNRATLATINYKVY